MAERKIGPGHTRWEKNETGSVNCIRWNDPSWNTVFAREHQMTPDRLPTLLRKAYEMGRSDQATIIQNALNPRFEK